MEEDAYCGHCDYDLRRKPRLNSLANQRAKDKNTINNYSFQF